MKKRLLVLLGCLLVPCPPANADGGKVRLSARQGDYQITILTAPTPLRAGPVDVSVLLQNPATGEPIHDATVTVRAHPRGRPGKEVHHPATTEAATNKLYHAANFELAEPGWWVMEVAIEGPRGTALVRFEVEAAEPMPRIWAMLPWIGWPALAILLFGIHQALVWKKSSSKGTPTAAPALHCR